MSKRRGVVLSTANKPHSIGKSKSANLNHQPHELYNPSLEKPIMPYGYQSGCVEPMANQEMVVSNMIQEEPTRMVNHAHYTYQDPDHDNHISSNLPEQNEEQVIESMQKKKDMIQARKKEEFLRKAEEKKKVTQSQSIKEKQPNRQKEAKKTATIKNNEGKSQPARLIKVKNHNSRQKCARPNCRQFQNEMDDNQDGNVKKVIDSELLKPRPLDFRVDMLDKNCMHSPHKKRKDYLNANCNFNFKERGQTQKINSLSAEHQNSGLQNANCKRLPYRLCDFS